MALAIAVAFRKLLQRGEVATNAKLNQMLDLGFTLSGTVDTSGITAGAVTPAKASGGAWFWGTDAGTANAHVVTTAQPFLTLDTGSVIAYKAAVTNTAAVTVNVNALGVKSIKNVNGQELRTGDIRASQVIELRYDGTNWVLIPVVVNTGDRYILSTGSANAYVLTFGGTTGWPTVPAHYDGLRVAFKANFGNTGAATLAVDGLTAKAVRKADNQPLVSGDLLANMLVEVVYDLTLDVFLLASGTQSAVAAQNASSKYYNWVTFK